MLLGGHACSPVNITEWPILACDRDSDVCTLQVPETFDPRTLNKNFFELTGWPHHRAQVSDKAFIIGYPAEHRTGSPDEILFRITPISDFVTDAGPRRFTIADESAERQILYNPESLTVPEHFGGMSGSPAFRMIEGAAPEFIGILVESSDGLGAAFFCAHVDFILDNGLFYYGIMSP
jgi:hypothetical protein